MISYRWSLLIDMHPVIASWVRAYLPCATCQLSLSQSLSLWLSLSVPVYRNLRRRHLAATATHFDWSQQKKENAAHTYTHTHSHAHAGRQTHKQTTLVPLYFASSLSLFSCFFWYFFVGNKKKIKKICF